MRLTQYCSCLALTCCLFSSATFGNSLTTETPQRLAPLLTKQQNMPVKDTNAETLYSITQSHLYQDGHWTRTIYISVRVNSTVAARDYGRISIPFNHYYSDLSLDFANTISADGKLHSLAGDAMQHRVTGGGQDFYSDTSELVFSLPDISAGSILEFQYTRSSKLLAFSGLYGDRTMPYWFQPTVGNDGWRGDFVHEYRYELIAPDKTPLFTKAFAGYPDKPKIRKKNGTKTYTWNMREIPGIFSEAWMPLAHDFLPTLHYSTIDDWREVDTWAWDKINEKLAPTPAIEGIIKALNLSEHASNEDKVRAVYEYLQKNIRYVFAHLGRGGYEPHFPDKVLQVNYGDCKDQTVLAVALLRRLGINAYPALVETPRSGKADTDTVSIRIFDHMMVHIPAGQGVSTQWLDSTGDRSLFPGVSNYLVDQSALIVNGRGGEMTRIPELGPNKAQLIVDYYPEENGASRAELKLLLEGSMEQNVRNWWIHVTDRDNALNQYLSVLFSNYQGYSANLKHSENIWQPAEINAQFHFAETDDFPAFGASMAQMLRLFTNIGGLPLPETRKTFFYDTHAFELLMNVRFHANANSVPALIKSGDEYQTPYFSLRNEGYMEHDDYVLSMHFRKEPLHLTQEDYADYYAAINELNQTSIWLVKMLPDSGKSNIATLAKKRERLGEDSAEYFIAKARSHIELGQFTEALAPAEKAVNLQDASGEAWYVLAMAQGFNSLIEESTLSFAKAEALGYLP